MNTSELKVQIDLRLRWTCGALVLLLLPSLFRWFLRPFALMSNEFDLFMGLASWPNAAPAGVMLLGWLIHAVTWFLIARWYFEILVLLRKNIPELKHSWLVSRVCFLGFLYAAGLPYFSADVFFYLGKGWLDFAYGLPPFDSAISDVPGYKDVEMFGNVFPGFYAVKGNYGHLFHWITRQVVSFCGGNQVVALLAFKVLALLCHGVSLWAVVGIARQLKLKSSVALWAYGGNPVLLFNALWATHNDILILPCILFSVWMALTLRPVSCGLFLGAGFCLKLVPILMLPFLLIWFLRVAGRPLVQGFLFLASFSVTVLVLSSLNEGGASAYSWLATANPYKSIRSSLMLPLVFIFRTSGSAFWVVVPTVLKGIFCIISAYWLWKIWKDFVHPPNSVKQVRLVRILAWVFCFYLVVASPIVTEWYLLWFLPFWGIIAREREMQGIRILTWLYLPIVIFSIKMLVQGPPGILLIVVGQLALYFVLLTALIRTACSPRLFRMKVF